MNRIEMRTWFVGAAAAVTFAGIGTTTAFAERAAGGATIASAPKVSFGTQNFGNTDSVAPIGCQKREWWLLPMIAGDHLVMDWQNSSSTAGASQLELYGIGTTDFNINNNPKMYFDGDQQGSYINANNRAELVFDAPSTGNYPLAFYASNCSDFAPGAYDFKPVVHHRTRLTITVSESRLRGVAVITAHFPDGTTIASGLGATLYGYWNKAWNKLGQASVANGTIRVPFSLAASLKGSSIKIQAKTGGSSFLGAKIVAPRITVK